MSNIGTRHSQLTVSCRQQSAQHTEGCGLPGAVGSEKAEDRAAPDIEADMVHSSEGTELPDQVPDMHGYFVAVRNGRPIEGNGGCMLMVSHPPEESHKAIF